MKNAFVRLAAIFLIFALLPFGIDAEKRALIIAIGNYEIPHNGYYNISSLNDVPLIDSLLVQSQFKNIMILTEGQATKSGIVAALNRLVDSTQKGDIVAVHFSCHGVLITDENGGNPEEALVAWDSPLYSDAGYKGEKHLTYTEIKKIRDRLRARAGATGDVLFVFDACHSGGLTRGTAKVRGSSEPVKIKGWITDRPPVTRGMPDEAPYLGGDNTTVTGNMSSYEAISACKTEEVNTEYRIDNEHNCGSLSFAVFRAFLKASQKSESYSQLYADILDEMSDISPNQHPVMTGTVNNRGVFGGHLVPIESHFSFMPRSNNGTNTYQIDGGILKGLTAGSILEAYPSGLASKNGAKPLFKVKIIGKPKMLTCSVELVDTVIRNLHAAAYWLYVKELAFNGQKMTFCIDSLSKFPEKIAELQKSFARDTEVVPDNQNPRVFLTYRPTADGAGEYDIHNQKDGALIHTVSASYEDLKDYLIRYAQYCALKEVKLKNKSYAISCTLTNRDGSEIKNSLGLNKILNEGDDVRMTFRNESQDRHAVFINLFDFQPDGTFKLIKPDAQVNYQESTTVDADVSGPFGDEMIMAISSPQPLNLDALQGTTRGAATRGAGLSVFQDIFGRPTYAAPRGFDPFTEDGYTTNLYFSIEKK